MSSIADRVLRLAEESGLSRHDFAVQVGLDDSKLSKSLGGARRFSSLDLARIAEQCRVTVDWLVTGEDLPLAVAARTTGGSAGAALQLARRYSGLRADVATLGYSQPWRPLRADLDQGGWSDQGRQLARDALIQAGASGISWREHGLMAMIEQVFGIDVAVAELGDGFDGLAASSAEMKLIIAGTSSLPARQRFTLAHELGHLLAGDDQEIHLDRDVFDKGQMKDPSETRANAFAAAFLMPEHDLRQAAKRSDLTLEAFAGIACDLQVTPTALAFRLSDLGLIDAGASDRLRAITAGKAARLVARGPEFAQRVAEANCPRLPGLLVRDTYAAYESGVATLRPYAQLLGKPVDQLRRAFESEAGVSEAR